MSDSDSELDDIVILRTEPALVDLTSDQEVIDLDEEDEIIQTTANIDDSRSPSLVQDRSSIEDEDLIEDETPNRNEPLIEEEEDEPLIEADDEPLIEKNEPFIEVDKPSVRDELFVQSEHNESADDQRAPIDKVLALKERGNAQYNQHHYDEALELYTQALDCIEKFNLDKDVASKIHFNLAMVHSKLGAVKAALKECIKAIKLDPSYVKAHMKRAEIHTQLSEFNEAQIVYEYLNELGCENRDCLRLLEHNLQMAKRRKKRDYYEILGVHKFASEAEIKKSYRNHALKHHPDRHSDADEVSRRIEERRFKEVSEAYKVLSDPNQRLTYDQTQCSSGIDSHHIHGRAHAKPRYYGFQGFHRQHQHQFTNQDFEHYMNADPFFRAFKGRTHFGQQRK